MSRITEKRPEVLHASQYQSDLVTLFCRYLESVVEDYSNSEIILFFNYFMTLRPAETA